MDVFSGIRLGTGFVRASELTSLPPQRHSSGSYLDSEGLRHQDDFDVSLLVCHSAAPFEEQGEAERHVLRSDLLLRMYPFLRLPSTPTQKSVAVTLSHSRAPSLPQASVLRGAYQPTRTLPKTHC